MANPTTIKTRGTQSGLVTAIVSPGASLLSQLGDVFTTGVANGYLLAYNATNNRWEAVQSVPSISAGTLTTPQTRIYVRYTDTIGSIPTAGQLDAGEIVLNRADGKLFFKDTANGIVTLQPNVGGGGGGSSGLTYVRVATSANLAGATYDTQTFRLRFNNNNNAVFDQITLVEGDRVLVKNQSDARQNGIYTVTTVGSDVALWTLTRSVGFQESEVFQTALIVIAQQGVIAGDTLFIVTTPTSSFTLDSDVIEFASPLGVLSEVNVANNVFLKPAGIGVGISSPTEAVDVNGNIKASGNILISGAASKFGLNSNSAAIELSLGEGRTTAGTAAIKMYGASGATVDTTISVDAAQKLTLTNTGAIRIDATKLGFNADATGTEEVRIGGDTKVTGYVSVDGDLVVDTNVLVVDVTNNRVGMGTASPSEVLDVVGNAKVSGNILIGGATHTIGNANADGSAVTVAIGSGRTNGFGSAISLGGGVAGATSSVSRAGGTNGMLSITNNGTGGISLNGAEVNIEAPAYFDSTVDVGTNLGVGGNLTVTGNLTINGTTTTVNSTVTTLDDPVITLGGDTVPASNDSKDRGVEFRWHNGTDAKVGFFGFDASTGKFTFIPDATNTSEVFSGTKGILDVSVDFADILNKPDPVITLGTDATGSVTLTDLGSGTLNLTLNTVNSNVGTFPKVTVNAKGLVTAGTALIDTDIPSVLSANARLAIAVDGTTVETRRKLNFVTGDVTAVGSDVGGSEQINLTLGLSNTGVTAGSAYNNFTVDAKGRVTAASTVAYLLAADESKDFKTVVITDTDTGYTWAGTGNIVAETLGDTLTIVSGAGINVDADTTLDALRITNTDRGSAQNIFKNFAVAGQSNIVADNNDDTLTVAGGTGIVLTTDATTDTLTITLGASGVVASTYNNVTVDSFGRVTAGTNAGYLLAANESQDIKSLQVTDTDSGYTWAGTGTTSAAALGDTIKIVSGSNINVDVDASGKAIRISNTFAEADTLGTVTGRGASTNTAVTFAGGATIDGTTNFRNNADTTTVSIDAENKAITIGAFTQSSVTVTGLSTSLIAIDITAATAKTIKYLVYVDAGSVSETSELHILRGQDNSVQIVQYGLLTTAANQIVSFAAEYDAGSGTTRLFAQTSTGTADIQLLKTTIAG
jgi:hypothetical protein